MNLLYVNRTAIQIASKIAKIWHTTISKRTYIQSLFITLRLKKYKNGKIQNNNKAYQELQWYSY